MHKNTVISPLAGALLAASLLLAGPVAQAKDTPEPVAVDAGFKAADQAQKLITVSDTKVLKGLTKVAVPQFSVEFVTFDNASAETSGFAAAGRASVSAAYKLIGVGQEDFQAMAESLYADFVRELQASGLEVVGAEQLSGAPSYRKQVAGGTPAPIISDNAIVVAPAGMALYGANRVMAEGSKSKGVLGALSALSNVGSAIGSAFDNLELQKELGGAALLEVHMRVHFVKLTNNNKGFFGRLSSTASVSAKAYPSITTASMSVLAGAEGGSMSLKQPLTLDAAAFSDVREEATTAKDVAGALLAGLIRMASGSKDSSEYKRFETVADAGKYREVVGGGLGLVREMLVTRLKAER